MKHLDYNSAEIIVKTMETNKSTKDIVASYWKEIGDDVVTLVKSVKAKPKMYKNDYGHYMQLLTSLNDDGKGLPLSLAVYLLIKAKADHVGVIDAYRILIGNA